MIQRMAILAGALAGGIAGSQAPEFATQYNQRLGGAIGELRWIVLEWNETADRYNTTPEELAERYEASGDPALIEDSQTKARVYDRYEGLVLQQRLFAEWPRIAHPFVLVRSSDEKLLSGAWDDFHPALPGTLPALAWLGVGLLAGGFLIWGPWTATSRMVARRRSARERMGAR